MKHKLEDLEKIATEVRRDVIKMILHAGAGHPAGSLGMVDVFSAVKKINCMAGSVPRVTFLISSTEKFFSWFGFNNSVERYSFKFWFVDSLAISIIGRYAVPDIVVCEAYGPASSNLG